MFNSCSTYKLIEDGTHLQFSPPLFLPQIPACWYVSWPAAPPAPWPCPSHSPPTWSRFGSRRRWTWTAWRAATTAPCRPTNTSTRTRAFGDSGKVPGRERLSRRLCPNTHTRGWRLSSGFFFLNQARCPTSPETHWSTAQSWWPTTWSRRPFWSTNSCQVWHTHTHTLLWNSNFAGLSQMSYFTRLFT